MPKRGMDSCGLHVLILDSTEMIRTDGSPHIEIQWIIPCPMRSGNGEVEGGSGPPDQGAGTLSQAERAF